MPFKYNPLSGKLDYYEAAGTVAVQSGVVGELSDGERIISFNAPLNSNNYALTLMVTDSEGVGVDYRLIIKETTGFTIDLAYPAYINYIAAE
jgi:hypothetical protein